MPQFDFYIFENQMLLTLVGFIFFYLFITKTVVVQLKMYDTILHEVINYKPPVYSFLKLNAFVLTKTK
jgi:hypothetical protein